MIEHALHQVKVLPHSAIIIRPSPIFSILIDGYAYVVRPAVVALLVCYALEERSLFFILGFDAACALGLVYGFLQGGVAVRGRRSNLGRRRIAALAIKN
jgi:hypothetical protein